MLVVGGGPVGMAALYDRAGVPVRPDGHVAGRSDDLPDDPA